MPNTRRSPPSPFFDTTKPVEQGSRRLLLLSPHFPPGQAAGALRWQKVARFAAERGWGLDVLTLDPKGLSDPDESRLADLPEGVRIYGIPRPTLWVEHVEEGLLKLKSRLRSPAARAAPAGAAAFVPSREAFAPSELRGWPRTPREWVRAYDAAMEYARDGAWARRAAATAERIFDPARHRLVVSCGPPHMAHEGGRRVSERCGLPLVVDMRDPWRLVEQLPPGLASPAWRRLAERYEPRMISRASLVVMNTPLARDAMQRTYPEHSAQVIAVLNGWDEEPLPQAPHESCFLVSFVGSIYLDRDPRPFFRAAGRVVRELHLSPDEFAIEFVGDVATYGGVATPDLAAAEGLAGFFHARPPLPRRKALKLQARAALLLNLPESVLLTIPSKIYDYLRFPAWVLSLSNPASATAWLLKEVGADVVDPEDLDAIAGLLRQRILQHRRGERAAPLTDDPRFSRRAQAGLLFDEIEGIVGSGAQNVLDR